MNSRETILARVRRARTSSDAVIATRLREHPRGPLPNMSEDLLTRFRERAARLASDVQGPLSAEQVPTAVANYLRERSLPVRAVRWPSIGSFEWGTVGMSVEARAARADDMVGITGAFCAIAETGTLMLLSGADTPAATSLLPETHVALVPISRIVARMEDGWDLLRMEHGLPPRAVNFVSGPSRTADIEQTVTLGAHGPYRVCIVLVADAVTGIARPVVG
ncbi:MAG: lactate utilization protein C [Pseudomonadota bacterium]|nr:MAG: lactate utilization protein C [Pseudomonadota bacterium]